MLRDKGEGDKGEGDKGEDRPRHQESDAAGTRVEVEVPRVELAIRTHAGSNARHRHQSWEVTGTELDDGNRWTAAGNGPAGAE